MNILERAWTWVCGNDWAGIGRWCPMNVGIVPWMVYAVISPEAWSYGAHECTGHGMSQQGIGGIMPCLVKIGATPRSHNLPGFSQIPCRLTGAVQTLFNPAQYMDAAKDQAEITVVRGYASTSTGRARKSMPPGCYMPATSSQSTHMVNQIRIQPSMTSGNFKVRNGHLMPSEAPGSGLMEKEAGFVAIPEVGGMATKAGFLAVWAGQNTPFSFLQGDFSSISMIFKSLGFDPSPYLHCTMG